MLKQITIAGLIAIVLALMGTGILYHWQITYSLLLGSLLWMLPSCYLAYKLFYCVAKVPASSLLKIFYRTEIRKLLLSGIFFVMIIKLVPVNLPALIAAYFASHLIFWLCLLGQQSSKNKEALS